MSWWYRPQVWHWPLILLLLPLSLVYWAVAALRRSLYQRGLLGSYRAPVPVVVVGNISVGGNGKTPVVMALVEYFQSQGVRVGVISRGYGGKAPHYPLLLNAQTPASESGDEPKLIQQRLACPVVVSPDRRAGIELLLKQGVDLVVADDGMQHYAMQRDLELVVVDSERGHGNGLCFPAGPLRELPSRLKEVELVIANGDGAALKQTGVHQMSLQAQALVQLSSGMKTTELPVREVHAMAGIGNPQRFYQTLQQQGVAIDHTINLADHGKLNQHQIESLQDKLVLMTEKDAIKYQACAGEHWYYLPVTGQLSPAFYQALDQQMSQIREHYAN